MTDKARHNIPTHPNPFDVLSEPLPYHDFIPGTDTDDDDEPDDTLPPAQPKTPKRTRKKHPRRRSSKATTSANDDDITDDERDLSMYRLSEKDSDSNLTIYYKAYNNNKPEMNESSSESTERTHRIKAIDMRMHWIRDRVRQGQFAITYIPTAENLADYFTKHLDLEDHNKFRQFLAL